MFQTYLIFLRGLFLHRFGLLLPSPPSKTARQTPKRPSEKTATLLNLKRRGYELGGHPVQVAAELAAIFEPSRLSLRGLVSAGYQPRPGLQVDTDELGKCLKTNLRVEDLIVDDYWLSKREARKHWSRVEKEERLARRGGSAASGIFFKII